LADYSDKIAKKMSVIRKQPQTKPLSFFEKMRRDQYRSMFLTAKHYRSWQKDIKGMSLHGAEQYLMQRNALLAKQAEEDIKAHSRERNAHMFFRIQASSASPNNLVFVVAGADHCDPDTNHALKQYINEGNPLLVLNPKGYTPIK
jgi:hypothetical protein